jgi:gamma-glutamyl-gamma-aminobutyrate hydrolase PuuD
VVFTGGSDVTPSYYREANKLSHCNLKRDELESAIFYQCKENAIPMMGICRGSQFLHVMMGGKLWQDVDNHCCQHSILDMDTGEKINDTTSTHHQMVRMKWDRYSGPSAAGFTLMATPDIHRSSYYTSAEGTITGVPVMEVEGYRYQRGNASIIGVQGHPEWGGNQFAKWAAKKLLDFHKLTPMMEPMLDRIDVV